MPELDRESLRQMREDIADWVYSNPRLARRVMVEYRDLRIRLARDDVNEFIEFVMLDETTGAPVIQEPIHEEFQRLADVYDRLILWGHVESGKTSQFIGRALFEIGKNPNVRFAVVSSSARNQAGKIAETVKTYIERSKKLKMVFPHLAPGKNWTTTSFTVNRTSYSKDPTVQSTSVETSSLTGSRIDRFLIDDLLTFDNTRTKEQRERTFEWLNSSTIMGRLTAEGAVWFLGNAFHPEDAMHKMAKNPAWHFAKFPVMDQNGGLTWPERWPEERIEKRRREIHPDEFARQLMCVARDDSAGRFKRAWIQICQDRGMGKTMAHALNILPPGYAVYTGVDLAVGKKKKSASTVLFTIVVHPNGSREVVNIESGKWAGNEIVDRIIDIHRRYNSIVYVENNGVQQYILDFTKDQSAVPCKPLHTGKNKVHPEFGIEGLATEMSNGKWIIPSSPGYQCHPEIKQWIDELVYYDPREHSGDRLMASWIARQGVLQWEKRPKMKGGRIDTVAR